MLHRSCNLAVLPIRPVVVAAALALGTTGAHAQSVADFYAGKTLSIQVGYSVGGGYDQYARVLAQFMSKHIPGKPQIVVKNMPGAGSLKLAIYMHTVAPNNWMASIVKIKPMFIALASAVNKSQRCRE